MLACEKQLTLTGMRIFQYQRAIQVRASHIAPANIKLFFMQNQQQLGKLQEKFPWPDECPPARPVQWAFDGGGKHLVTEILAKKPTSIVLEIGSWLAGSTQFWLDASPKVAVIALDPWPGVNKAEIRHQGLEEWAIKQLERPDGLYQTFLSNMWNDRERVTPVRGYSPDMLNEIHQLGVSPDLIYLDADKSGREIEICHQLFPDAIMTGDDWGWESIQSAVRAFCKKHGRYFKAELQTWVISSERPSLRWRLRSIRRRVKTRIREGKTRW